MYTEITAAAIEVGKALKKSLFTLIRDNFIDHETRINDLESGTSRVGVFNFEVFGFTHDYKTDDLQQIGTHYATNNFTMTEVEIRLTNNPGYDASSSEGILAIDVEKSDDGGVTWTSILVSDVVIEDGVSATGSISAAANFIGGEEDIVIDDILRVSIKSKKDTQGSFLILAYGEIS